MCWSGEASTVLATVGLSSTAYAAYKKEPAPLWMALGYFSLMEALQAYTYYVIDDCESPQNQIATLLGYLHITFQPFFINALSLHFIPERIAKKVSFIVYTLCSISVVVMLIQLYPFSWAGTCQIRRPLCGELLCSVSGNWHIAWDLPLNGIGNTLADTGIMFLKHGLVTYTFTAFLVPILYGSWKLTLYHFLMGPFIAKRLTDNPNEWPAIWCLLSIAILLIVVKTPFRKLLYVKKWYFWSNNTDSQK